MISAAAAARNVNNARALENGILYMTVIPMFLKFLLYGVSTQQALSPSHGTEKECCCLIVGRAYQIMAARVKSHHPPLQWYSVQPPGI